MSTTWKPIDVSQVQTTSMRKRDCRLHIDMLAGVPEPGKSLKEFFQSLPKLGCASELLAAADCLTRAALAEKDVIWLIDSCALEAGLSPLIIKMIQRGLIRVIAMTGGAAVRDYELAVFGMTQEDVGKGLSDGLLGMARETGEAMNSIINEGVKRGFGLGECLGRGILERQPKYYTQSILAACAARVVPCTIHVAIGSEGFHRHPTADGAMLGKGSLKDLQVLGARLERLNDGGVLVATHTTQSLNEAFLHAYGLAQNLGHFVVEISLIRFGKDSPRLSELPGLNVTYHLPAPLEIALPLFTGVVFSLVE